MLTNTAYQIYLSSVISTNGYPSELYSGWKLRHGYQNSDSFVLPSASDQTPGHCFCQTMTFPTKYFLIDFHKLSYHSTLYILHTDSTIKWIYII